MEEDSLGSTKDGHGNHLSSEKNNLQSETTEATRVEDGFR
jgi:hypothetical protein